MALARCKGGKVPCSAPTTSTVPLPACASAVTRSNSGPSSEPVKSKPPSARMARNFAASSTGTNWVEKKTRLDMSTAGAAVGSGAWVGSGAVVGAGAVVAAGGAGAVVGAGCVVPAQAASARARISKNARKSVFRFMSLLREKQIGGFEIGMDTDFLLRSCKG
ncbi:MAG: hypothetical protein HUU23_06565 [Caldilineales bacterium]|nr:hypothetical protein [Caldilineales bacterium]